MAVDTKIWRQDSRMPVLLKAFDACSLSDPEVRGISSDTREFEKLRMSDLVPMLAFGVPLDLDEPTCEGVAEPQLSLVFSRLRTPRDIVEFARSYGPLFSAGFCCEEADRSGKEAPERFARDLTFDVLGKIFEDASDYKSIQQFEREGTILFFEEMEDWLVAIRVLRVANAMGALLRNGFDLRVNLDANEQYDYIAPKANAAENPYRLVIDRAQNNDGTFFTYNLISCLLTADDMRRRTENDLDSPKKLNSSRYLEGLARQFNGSRLPGSSGGVYMCVDDFGALRLNVSVGPGLRNEEAVADSLKRGICYLLDAHRPLVRHVFDGCTVKYNYDAVLPCVWNDAESVMRGTLGMSACPICGNPFAYGNKGRKREYCSDVCREKAKKRRQRARAGTESRI